MTAGRFVTSASIATEPSSDSSARAVIRFVRRARSATRCPSAAGARRLPRRFLTRRRW
ncbi:hypothetical protein [Actinophytocola oryzae]|uniref:hypothetical protein n=1 Tax=Actinophytocola oryzae TaxID=502181 RepID=UPI001414F643|nr:hypothetical protein [Actinophytocola oryzae]